MKTKKKALIIALAALLLLTTAVGTMAWLHDWDDEPAQVFTIGDISLNLTVTKLEGEAAVLVPNQTYAIDPTVTVAADSEDAYARVWMTITDAADVQTTMGASKLSDVFTVDSKWAYYGNDINGDAITGDTPIANLGKNTANNTIVLEIRRTDKVLKGTGTAEEVITNIQLPYYLNNNDVALLSDALTLHFRAEAMQAESLNTNTADYAWEQFTAQLAGGSINNPNTAYGD